MRRRLATDWEWLQRVMRGESRIAEAPSLRPAAATLAYSFRASVLAALLLPLPFVPALLQLEWFPVTHVPMYGSYLAPGVIAGIPEVDFGVETRVREIARSCAGSRTFGYTRRCSWRIPRYLVDRTSLELRGPGQPPAPFPGSALMHSATRSSRSSRPVLRRPAKATPVRSWRGASTLCSRARRRVR